MKTILFLILTSTVLQTISAQNDLASAIGAPISNLVSGRDELVSSEPAVSAWPNTVNDEAFVHFARGLCKSVVLQVLTPSTDMLINQKIPAGQTRIRINLAGLPDGTYTIRVNLGDRMWVKQVVKG